MQCGGLPGSRRRQSDALVTDPSASIADTFCPLTSKAMRAGQEAGVQCAVPSWNLKSSLYQRHSSIFGMDELLSACSGVRTKINTPTTKLHVMKTRLRGIIRSPG